MEKFIPNPYSSFSEIDQLRWHEEMQKAPIEFMIEVQNDAQMFKVISEGKKIKGAENYGVSGEILTGTGSENKIYITFYIKRWDTEAFKQLETLSKRMFPKAFS